MTRRKSRLHASVTLGRAFLTDGVAPKAWFRQGISLVLAGVILSFGMAGSMSREIP